MYIQASWSRKGRAGATDYSTKLHGVLGAVALALQAPAAGSGRAAIHTPRQAWAQIREAGRDQ